MTSLNEHGMPVHALCFDPEDDRLLALGYPHLRFLVDPLPKAATATKAAQTHAYEWGKSKLQLHWPRNVATRFVRAAATDAFQDWTSRLVPTAADRARCDDDRDLDVDEARSLVERTVSIHGCSMLARYWDVFYLLEALLGSDWIADTIVGSLEALPESAWTDNATPNRKTAGAILTLGLIMRRLSPERRAAIRERLGAFSSLMEAGLDAHIEPPVALDLVLRGSKSRQLSRAHDQAYVYLDPFFLYAGDDPDKIRWAVAHKDTIYTSLNPQFVYLAGPEILDRLGKHRPAAKEIPKFIEEIGKIKYPAVVTLMLELVGRPTAKTLPVDWLRAHQSYAQPRLEEIASGRGELADKATMVLGAL